jgi:hypothetical protein
MGRRFLVALAVVAVAWSNAAAATALTPPPGFSDAGDGGMRSDGVRWLVLGRPGPNVEVTDARTGGTRTLKPPDGCGATGVGGLELALTCPGKGGNQPPLVADLTTGAFSPVEPVARRIAERPSGASGYLSASYTDVGRYWLRVTSTYYHDATWDDLYRRSDGLDISADDVSPRRNPDPDARSGSVPLCRPLHRRIGPQGFDRWPTYAPYGYERPYGLTTDKRGLVLERCGSRPVRLSADPQVYSDQLGARYVTWAERSGRVGLYDIRARRKHVFRFQGAGDFDISAVAHTRTQIAVSAYSGYPPEQRVYLARIADVARR